MKHLLGLEGLSAAALTRLLDAAEGFDHVGVGDVPKRDDLKGKVVVNLFYEPSTRTRVSFGLAARRLGADVLDFSPSGSTDAETTSLAILALSTPDAKAAQPYSSYLSVFIVAIAAVVLAEVVVLRRRPSRRKKASEIARAVFMETQ